MVWSCRLGKRHSDLVSGEWLVVNSTEINKWLAIVKF